MNIAPRALAETPGSTVPQTLQELQAQGISQVGDLNLQELEQQSQQVQWHTTETLNPPTASSAAESGPAFQVGLDASGKIVIVPQPPVANEADKPERRSAFYQTSIHSVTVLAELPPGTEAMKPQLELHEDLGALGYNDKHYALSTALMTLKRTQDPQLRQDLLKSFGDHLFNQSSLRSSGGSSVGGGGDIWAIIVKNRVLQNITNSHYRVLPEFYEKFPEIGFEPFYDQAHQFVGTEYELRLPLGVNRQGDIEGTDRSHSFEELITIHFPVLLWTQSTQQQEKIIQQISQILLSIFPISEGESTKVMTPMGCPASVQVMYPTLTAPGTELIRQERSSLLNNCDRSTLGQLMPTGSLFIRTPSW